jgi:hypothetical protein
LYPILAFKGEFIYDNIFKFKTATLCYGLDLDITKKFLTIEKLL